MEPYSQTPLNLALRSERKAEEFIKTWRFNHAAHYYQKAAENVTKALEEEKANNLVPNSILESLEEQRKFYLYQERICHNRRSHVGHLFKDKGQLSYNLSKQAEQFAQAHSLLIRSQNHLQQQQQQLSEQQPSEQRLPVGQTSTRIDDTDRFERERAEETEQHDETTRDTTRLLADAIDSYEISQNFDNKLRIADCEQDGKSKRKTRQEKNTYNITSNPLCDHHIESDSISSTIAPTTSTALVLRPPESSFAVMAKSTLYHNQYNNAARANNKQTNPAMEPFKEEDDPEDYDLGDKFNEGSIAYRNLLYEINRLFSEHNTLLDNLGTTLNGQQQQQQQQQQRQSRQSTQEGNNSELLIHRPMQQTTTTMQFSSDTDNKKSLLDNKIGDNSGVIPMTSPQHSNSEWKGEINDQKFSDTLNKLRWNQSKLRNIISDLVQQLEKTSEDNERLRCQIMTQRNRPSSSRSDQLCHLPPLEPPTLQY